MTDFLLSFEVSKDSNELDIHCDEAGLSQLLMVLSHIKNGQSHEHLMTPSWGGNELSEEKQSESSQLLNKVTIHKW